MQDFSPLYDRVGSNRVGPARPTDSRYVRIPTIPARDSNLKHDAKNRIMIFGPKDDGTGGPRERNVAARRAATLG